MCIDAKSDGIKIMILSLSLVALSTLLHYNIGLNLTNEGYLWYGSVQTLAGKVPMRDFRSYDPGRYYWCAGWMKLLGEGIISLRISNAIFQTIGLTLGLLAIRRVIRSWLLMVVAGSILLMWMTPRYKVIDSSLAMAGVFFAVRLLEKPSSRRFLISGIFVGLAGFLGRNHGLYNFLAFLTLILFIRYKLEKVDLLKSAFVWFIGILIGYSPMLIMMLTISGLFESFLYPFGKMLRLGSTNLPIPVPWPWVPDYSKMNFMQIGRSVSIGILFLLLPIFYAVSALFLWIRFEKRWILKTPLLPAAVFL